MKKILASQRIIENTSYDELREALDVQWGQFFSALEMLLIPLPINATVENYFTEVDVDGVLLTGGNDLASFDAKEINRQRDDFENKLVSISVAKNIPLFGVCRGMQLIAQYFDMSLTKTSEHVAKEHEIVTCKDSKYFQVLPASTLVNSYHNFGISNVGSEFKTIAKASDSTVEAFEHKSLAVAGMMWHPERNLPFKRIDLQIFKTFFSNNSAGRALRKNA